MKCLRPLTVDAIVLCEGRIVLIRRKNEPYQGMLALPGGFVERDETVEQAVVREAREETGLDTEIVRLVGVYSDPGRDPRGPIVSVCYLVKATGGRPGAASDAAAVELVRPDEVPALAFDHDRMVGDARLTVEIR
ncbi:MAG: ADP-ribose pyrophosphatase [Methanocella sp. PtaU1.Bin125]|nr:MAG: ADP-ribose pyrophosphatase [Methanocella sp. PtaU1.Bin125]